MCLYIVPSSPKTKLLSTPLNTCPVGNYAVRMCTNFQCASLMPGKKKKKLHTKQKKGPAPHITIAVYLVKVVNVARPTHITHERQTLQLRGAPTI